MTFLLSSISSTTYFDRLNTYLDDPTLIKGIDFVGPMALKAVERHSAEIPSKYEIKFDSGFNLDNALDEIWIENILKIVERLSFDVIGKISAIFSEFPQNEEAKSELGKSFVRITRENGIHLESLFKTVIGNQIELFKTIKNEAKKEWKPLIKEKLYKELLKWHGKHKKERILKIYKYVHISPFTRMPRGLEKDQKEEIFKVKMKYFDLIGGLDQKIYTNKFLLEFYEGTNEKIWKKKISKLKMSTAVCSKEKSLLEVYKKKEISDIKQKYKKLFKKEEEKELNKGEYLKFQFKYNVNDEIQENELAKTTPREDIRELDDLHTKELDELAQIMQMLTQKKKEEKKRCIIM